MLSKLMRIGLMVMVIALLLGNLAVCIEASNEPQNCHGSNPNKCNGQCVNLQSDKQNCGDCGKVCDSDEVCHHGRCASSNNNNQATCTDGKKNGKETDIDCGGSTCPACGDGKTCKNSTDCSSGVCSFGHCQIPSCIDGVKNENETGVDCGGSCKPCLKGIIGNPVQIYNPPAPPTYKIGVSDTIIDYTRSPTQDTDYASLGVSVNNRIFTPKTKFIGDTLLANYKWKVGLEFGPIPIPDDPTFPVSIAYLIVNAGSPPNNVIYIMDAGTEALLRSSSGSGSTLSFADSMVGDMLTSYCDGTVAADKIVTNGHQIAQWTAAGTYSGHSRDPGTDSSVGCGPTSYYEVDWYIERVS